MSLPAVPRGGHAAWAGGLLQEEGARKQNKQTDPHPRQRGIELLFWGEVLVIGLLNYVQVS